MTDCLPPAPWTKRPDLARLVAALGAGNARYVGGAVRDTLLGIEVKDIDLATPLIPEDVMARLDAAKIGHVPTGIAHGTITAILKGGPVEITTLRHDVSTDGRRATVAFASDWQDDAARRDFTINALYADPATGEISDFFGGLDDLKARRVRFIGDARERIREDHLRILRYFRFQARFGSQPADAESEAACAELAATLKGLSRERIGMEMLNLLALPSPAPTVTRMAELGVMAQVLPEANVGALAALVAEEMRQEVAPDPIRRLAALLPPDADLAGQVAARFRLSGAQKKRLMSAAARNPPRAGEDPRALAYRLGLEQALDRLLLTGADTSSLKDWTIPTFPLKGGEIVARGIKAGPEVARILRAVEDRWVAEGFPAPERVSALLDEALAR
jgi:poly(A) polymerase